MDIENYLKENKKLLLTGIICFIVGALLSKIMAWVILIGIVGIIIYLVQKKEYVKWGGFDEKGNNLF